MKTKTYTDIIALIEAAVRPIYVPVFYVTGTYEWLPVDRDAYLRQLKLITAPEAANFPCYVEVEDDNIFFHPRINHSEMHHPTNPVEHTVDQAPQAGCNCRMCEAARAAKV
jgi:hypothetical protein